MLLVLMVLESAFIEALRETPDDADLRLVYADWLDDAGDSRGELVRLQCELDGTPLANPRRQVLQEAIREVCTKWQPDWLAPLQRRGLRWEEARFQFGLVENVPMSPTKFLKHAAAGLFEEMPYLVGVCLNGKESHVARALASPDIARLKSLKLTIYGSVESGKPIQRLLSLPTMRNLTSLDLESCGYGDVMISQLLHSANFPKLRRLNLQHNFLTSRIAVALADCSLVRQLEMLALGRRWQNGRPNQIGDWGIRVFTETAPPLKLRWLDLSANDLSDSSAWDLANSACLDHIECLSLGGNTFGNASQSALDSRFPGRVFYARCEPDCHCQEHAKFCRFGI